MKLTPCESPPCVHRSNRRHIVARGYTCNWPEQETEIPIFGIRISWSSGTYCTGHLPKTIFSPNPLVVSGVGREGEDTALAAYPASAIVHQGYYRPLWHLYVGPLMPRSHGAMQAE